MNTSNMLNAFFLVDYENLLQGLSHSNEPATDVLINKCYDEALNQFDLPGGIVFADWNLYAPPAVNENIILRTVYQGTSSSNLYRSLFSEIEQPEIYILITGSVNTDFIKEINDHNGKVIIWSLSDLEKHQMSLCLGWKKIISDHMNKSKWPRKINMQSIILSLISSVATDHATMSINYHDLIGQLSIVQKSSYHKEWVNIALLEHILYISPVINVKEKHSRLQLNHAHKLVKETLSMLNSTCSLFDNLKSKSNTASFASIEKCLRSSKYFSKNQIFRQAWLELLIATNYFATELKLNAQSKFYTTYLLPGSQFPANIENLHNTALIRLIVVVDNFIQKTGYLWISVSRLLEGLIGHITVTDARDALNCAISEKIILLEKLPNSKPGGYPVSALKLNYHNVLVQKSLSRRDTVIRTVDQVLSNRNQGVTLNLIRGHLADSNIIDADFWVDTFVTDGILRKVIFVKNNPLELYHIQLNNPIVVNALKP